MVHLGQLAHLASNNGVAALLQLVGLHLDDQLVAHFAGAKLGTARGIICTTLGGRSKLLSPRAPTRPNPRHR
eukprot:7386249-Prymnesium_polylepis.1